MKQYIISPTESGQRVDRYIKRILPNASMNFLYKMMRKKNITLNEKKITGSEILSSNDIVKLWFSDETFDKFSDTANDIDVSQYVYAYKSLKGIEVVYEDDDFLILDKPAGILSQKSDDNDVSVNEWLIGYLLDSAKITKEMLKTCKPSITNRLDRNTSGLILCGISIHGLKTFGRIIKDRDIKKLYHTIVVGHPKNEQILEGYLSKDNHKNIVNVINEEEYQKLSEEDRNRFAYIKTAYRLISTRYDSKLKIQISLIEVDLITGKSHQIRAHMAYCGFPLLGDAKYGDATINRLSGLPYQLLHSYSISFNEDEELNALSAKTLTSRRDISY